MVLVRLACVAVTLSLLVPSALAAPPLQMAAPQTESAGVDPESSDAALSPAVTDAALAGEQMGEVLAPPGPTLFAEIDLTNQVMTVSDSSGEIGTWPISSARAGYVTPTGTFSVNWTSRMHYSRQYDWAPMPYAVFFTRGVAVHATSAVGSLGRPASHGCVRLSMRNAKTFYNLVHKHGERQTRITVRGEPPYMSTVAERSRRYEEQAQEEMQERAPLDDPYGDYAYEPNASSYYDPGIQYYRRQRLGGRYYYGAW